MKDTGFLRIAALSPVQRVGDIAFNLDQIRYAATTAAEEKAGLVLLPELCLTGATAGDLFFQDHFYHAQMEAVEALVRFTSALPAALAFGFYIRRGERFYNCAGLAKGGHLFGIVPQLLPENDRLSRWFVSAGSDSRPEDALFLERSVPFGRLRFIDKAHRISLTLRVGSDLFAPDTTAGAGLLTLCPAAFPEWIGSAAFRRQSCQTLSRIGHTVCCLASSGIGESTAESVYSGHCLIAENGILLADTEPLATSAATYADIDCSALAFQRQRLETVDWIDPLFLLLEVPLSPLLMLGETVPLKRKYSAEPFVPENPLERADNCREAFHIQVAGLSGRLARARARRLVLGVSGGLDSTLALLVAADALKQSGRAPDDLIAVTMPGFGTSDQTLRNAQTMMRLLGADAREIPIREAVLQHFKDIGHDPADHNATYENAQARERTQILMDIANREGGIQIGTGDLSESALGWCTYNGDQMAMYNVNANNPKTFLRAQLRWFIDERLHSRSEQPFSADDRQLVVALTEVLETPVSPELLPTRPDGSIAQKTEDQVGPYILHDFFLFHIMHDGWEPRRILRVASETFVGQFTPAEILRWLTVFYRRFFAHQFKRNASPEGARIGTISLSPHGGYVMPSDIDPSVWLSELDSLKALVGLPE